MRYAHTPAAAVCPACTAATAEVLYTVTAAEAAQHYVVREAEPERHDAVRAHLDALWGGGPLTMLRCTRCGLGYGQPLREGDAAFFNLAFKAHGYPPDRWEFGRTRAALDAAWGGAAWGDRRLLEVGAGEGAFLKYVVPERLPADRALGLDVATYAVDAMRAAGFAAGSDDFRALGPDHDGRYDAVVCFQAVQGFEDPAGAFAAFGRLARPGGYLALSTPGAGRIAFNERRGGVLDLPPAQLTRWTRAAFEAAGARTGWALVSHALEPERAAAKVREFATYAYLKNRQRPGAPENRAEALGPGPARTLARAAFAATNLVRYAPALVDLVRGADLGGTQWALFRRGDG